MTSDDQAGPAPSALHLTEDRVDRVQPAIRDIMGTMANAAIVHDFTADDMVVALAIVMSCCLKAYVSVEGSEPPREMVAAILADPTLRTWRPPDRIRGRNPSAVIHDELQEVKP